MIRPARRLVLSLALALPAALAAADESYVRTPGKVLGKTPAGGGAPASPFPADHRHEKVAGVWAGMVTEVGADPYRMVMRLRADGTGEVFYEGYNCAGRLTAFPGGPQLRYLEKITEGLDVCSDGEVHLRLNGEFLHWYWYGAGGEARATARLERTIDAELPLPAERPKD